MFGLGDYVQFYVSSVLLKQKVDQVQSTNAFEVFAKSGIQAEDELGIVVWNCEQGDTV